MDFDDLKFGTLVSDVKKYCEEKMNGDWEKVRRDEAYIEYINTGKKFNYSELADFDITGNWDALIDYLKEATKKYQTTKLAKDVENNAEKPSGPFSTWVLYKKSLESKKWSESSIQQIEDTSFDVVKKLNITAKNSASVGEPIHGLVMGSVQSGKTANMTGLMAMAADNGINCFIVLTGVIENLRKQTANRLLGDLKFNGRGNLQWNSVTNPSPKDRLATKNISNFCLDDTARDRYIIATLKNKKRLEDLYSWLTYDKNKAKQLRILLIDDEADQASINTKDVYSNEEATAINNVIKKIVNFKGFESVNYVAYTATPFANILNESDPESLYPSEFMEVLEPAENYIGPEDIFGTEIPEKSPAVDIVEEISEVDKELIQESQKENIGLEVSQMPISLKNAINWFLLSVASLRALGYTKPSSMLIHTSFKVSDHKLMETLVVSYLKWLRANFSSMENQLEQSYSEEKIKFNKQDFLRAKPNYTNVDQVPEYPEWEQVRYQLKLITNLSEEKFVTHTKLTDKGIAEYGDGIQIAVDNSRAKVDEEESVRLIYPESKEQYKGTYAPAFIVIGGNTLSRGLTLEGLTCTYFLRTTNQADTLMQMGRWFGFRQGYEIFPRVWMDKTAMERYTFLSQMNSELRDEIKLYADQKFTPLEYAPKVKNGANQQFIRITSKNKMQSAKPMEFNFQGYNVQVYIFPNDEEKLSHNLKLTKEFLNSLNPPVVRNSKLVWEDVNLSDVHDYLDKYTVIKDNTKLRALPELLIWLKENSDHIDSWNVVFAEKDIHEILDENSNNNFIKGFESTAVTRTRKKEFADERYIDIGALRSPSDLLADIANLKDEDKELRNKGKISDINMIRNKYGVGQKPLLVIYRIDKDSKANKDSTKRNDLNAPCDIIGWSILIPGENRPSDFTEYVSNNINNIANPKDELDDILEEE